MEEDGLLYQRVMSHGPSVRIRRTTAPGVVPVIAVLEVDRRAGTPREGHGTPPPLMRCEAPSEDEARAMLEPHASEDRALVQMMHEKGLR
jgi:hypothetical protein